MDDVSRLAQSAHVRTAEQKLQAAWASFNDGVRVTSIITYNAVACLLYIAIFGPLALITAVCVNLCWKMPEIAWRYDPMRDIMLDHWLLVLDEPVIFSCYSLNPLFSKFDAKILQAMQLIWFNVTMKEFKQHLTQWNPAVAADFDNPVSAADAVAKLKAMNEFLTGTLKRNEDIPEAVARMKDWMEDNPVQPVKTPEE